MSKKHKSIYKNIPDSKIERWCEEAMRYRAMVATHLIENYASYGPVAYDITEKSVKDPELDMLVESIIATDFLDYWDHKECPYDYLDKYLKD